MQFNINDTVEFVLTEYGAEVWNKAYADCPALQRKPGPVSEQLWEVMRVLGPTMYNGALNSIESNRVTIRIAPEPDLRARIVQFLYLLARDHVSFGYIKTLIREHLKGNCSLSVFSSPGGQALANEIADELIHGSKPALERYAESPITLEGRHTSSEPPKFPARR